MGNGGFVVPVGDGGFVVPVGNEGPAVPVGNGDPVVVMVLLGYQCLALTWGKPCAGIPGNGPARADLPPYIRGRH